MNVDSGVLRPPSSRLPRRQGSARESPRRPIIADAPAPPKLVRAVAGWQRRTAILAATERERYGPDLACRRMIHTLGRNAPLCACDSVPPPGTDPALLRASWDGFRPRKV